MASLGSGGGGGRGGGLRRWIYLIHRWTGVAACLFIALWFVSGVTMLFVGYPKLTPAERLANMPALDAHACCVPLERALAFSRAPEKVQEIILTTIAGRPAYRLREDRGDYLAVDAATGRRIGPVDAGLAGASATAFVPGAVPTNDIERIREDRWTHSRGLDAHRPLWAVQMNDAAATRLYVSSATGQVVLDAPRAQRLWNFVGAWLHWLYFLRDRPVDPVWSWIVIGLSAVGTITALTGVVAGVWRWRFRGAYKSGSRSPYRENFLRWHHIAGLLFSAFVCTWIFSGLMSMNPLGVFDPAGARPDTVAYKGGAPGAHRLALTETAALTLLEQSGFLPVEIEWRVLAGEPFLLARDNAGNTRLVRRDGGRHHVSLRWDGSTLTQAGARLFPVPVTGSTLQQTYDAYYYARQAEAMRGADERRLPVLRLEFDRANETRVFIDMYTGEVQLSLDSAQRAGRWLFSFLHSWDLPPMLRAGPWRDAALIVLSLGGLALSATGVVIGWRRLRTRFAAGRTHSR